MFLILNFSSIFCQLVLSLPTEAQTLELKAKKRFPFLSVFSVLSQGNEYRMTSPIAGGKGPEELSQGENSVDMSKNSYPIT